MGLTKRRLVYDDLVRLVAEQAPVIERLEDQIAGRDAEIAELKRYLAQDSSNSSKPPSSDSPFRKRPPGSQCRRSGRRPDGQAGHEAAHWSGWPTRTKTSSTGPARDQNAGRRRPLDDEARKLIRRFERYEDMILRFVADLAVPFSDNPAERDRRPVKVQQRASGGCWRTQQVFADFALVRSHMSTVGT